MQRFIGGHIPARTRRRARAAAATALLGGLIAACGDNAAPPSRPHVIVVSIDTLRADHLHTYGYERNTSPYLDSLAQRGVVFEQALSQSTATLTSHLSMLTSLYPPQFRITRADRVNDNQHTTTLRIPAAVTTLAEVFADAGYRTGAFTGGAVTDPRFGFGQGFDVYRGARVGEEGLDRRLAWFTEWMDDPAATGAPLFAFIHTYDVHDPYGTPHPGAGEFSGQDASAFEIDRGHPPTALALRTHYDKPTATDVQAVTALYDDGIHAADAGLAALESLLRARGLWENTLIVVLSDHGEEFFEHGGWGHGPSVHRELVHVPWLIRFPGERFANTRRATPVELLDLAPTLTDAAGLTTPDAWRGRSLMSLIRGERPDTPLEGIPDDGPIIYADIPNKRIGLRSIRRGRWKLELTPKQQKTALYDLVADPAETRDLAQQKPGIVQRLGRDLETWLADLRAVSAPFQAEPISTDELSALRADGEERLRALGYIK